jgi:hypothetical protein
MNRDEGPKDYVSQYLRRSPIRDCVVGSVLVLAGLSGCSVCLSPLLMYPFNPAILILCALGAIAALVPAALGLWMAGRSLEEMLTPLARRPDGMALQRYGDPQQVLDAVNAELADGTGVKRLARRLRAFQLAGRDQGSSDSAEVWLTPSRVVCFTGRRADRLTIFQLADVVLAARCEAPPGQVPIFTLIAHTGVMLLDRHGVRLKMPLINASATRLLAELLARVPWAVNRIGDPNTDLGRYVAESDRRREELRREELRVTGQTPPTSPS